ncbi:MAG: chemotaxis protein CheW [Desulfovibrionaceae bacterium]
MNRELVKRHEKILLPAMGSVSNCYSVLTRLDRQLTRATLTGKINCSRIAQTLIDFISTTQDNFASLQQDLVETLVFENAQKVVLEISAVSQVAVDILKRNLFERTADVGFLATDDDIVQFLLNDARRPEAITAMEERLMEYRNKYTVYYEIIVLDMEGRVCAHLDRTNPITASQDPLIKETLAASEYVETYRGSDLAPERGDVLIYSQTIHNPETRTPIGVLCLLFDFVGEMKMIFENLKQSSADIITMILDNSGRAIASSDPATAPVGKIYPIAVKDDFQLVKLGTESFLTKTQPTKGYQGFIGLPWYGHVLKRVSTAFSNGANGHQLDEQAIRRNAIFSGRLIQVEETSENILSDLELVVQNGEIMAAKKSVQTETAEKIEAQALPHVLNEVKKIGDQVQHVFQTSTGDLLKLVTSSRLHDVQFMAQLAIDIMDRNLYERANDCRWWALTGDFRRILEKSHIDDEDRGRMRNILAYINNLYTVYTNLFLYDRNGKILACSNPSDYHHEGRILNTHYVNQTLKITDSQLYCVSDFEPTDLYSMNDKARHSYIYNASITSLKTADSVIGGIGIVFDSEPQFISMLNDALPRDEHGALSEGTEGMFVTPEGFVVSSTNAEIQPGSLVQLPDAFRQLSQGESTSQLIGENDKLFAVGCAHSAGYREYKRDGVYTNDLLGVIKVRI